MLGDDVFFNGIRRFYLSSRFRKVGTEDFRLAMEEESGRDLERFFERWIYNATLPQVTFSYTHRSRAASGQVAVLRFEQTGRNLRSAGDRDAPLRRRPVEGRHGRHQRPDRRSSRVQLDGALRSVSISKRDVALVDFKDAPSPGR